MLTNHPIGTLKPCQAQANGLPNRAIGGHHLQDRKIGKTRVGLNWHSDHPPGGEKGSLPKGDSSISVTEMSARSGASWAVNSVSVILTSITIHSSTRLSPKPNRQTGGLAKT